MGLALSPCFVSHSLLTTAQRTRYFFVGVFFCFVLNFWLTWNLKKDVELRMQITKCTLYPCKWLEPLKFMFYSLTRGQNIPKKRDVLSPPRVIPEEILLSANNSSQTEKQENKISHPGNQKEIWGWGSLEGVWKQTYGRVFSYGGRKSNTGAIISIFLSFWP